MTTKKFSTPLSSRLHRDIFFQTSADLPQIVELELGQITRNPDQPRKSFSEESLRDLAASIERHGLIQPITVKRLPERDGFLLVAGERRYRAFELLQKITIPAIITHGDPEEIALIENIQREDLTPLEEAEALSLMMERHRYTQEQLGQVIGKAQNTVSQFLNLLRLPMRIREEYNQAPIGSKSILMEIARLKTEAEQFALWEAVKDGRLRTVKAARAKHPTVVAETGSNPFAQTLVSGERFLKALERLYASANGLPLSEAEKGRLSGLQKRIRALIEGLPSPPPTS